jgi:hypothetical protein
LARLTSDNMLARSALTTVRMWVTFTRMTYG